MSAFLYAVSQGRVTRHTLADVGFPHAAIAGLPGGGCSSGPDDGKPCRVFSLGSPTAPGGKSARIGYFPEDQTWLSCADAAWWLGWDKSTPPVPADLRVPSDLRTRPVCLGDGSWWDVPVIRAGDGYPAVPTVDHINANGTIAIDHVEPQYSRLWELSCKLHDAAESQKYGAMSDPEYWEIVTASLGLLYRLSRWEIAALKLVTRENMGDMLAALLDMEIVEV